MSPKIVTGVLKQRSSITRESIARPNCNLVPCRNWVKREGRGGKKGKGERERERERLID